MEPDGILMDRVGDSGMCSLQAKVALQRTRHAACRRYAIAVLCPVNFCALGQSHGMSESELYPINHHRPHHTHLLRYS